MRRIAITDGRLSLQQDENAFRRAVHASAKHAATLGTHGVEAILLREKDLSAERLLQAAQHLVSALRETPARVLIAGPDALEVGRAAGAQGMHLGALREGEEGARQMQEAATGWPGVWLTVSCHSIEEAASAARLGVHAILFAPVFGKWIQGREVVEGVGLQRLHQACMAARGVPVFALGGVTKANASSCIEAGAAGIAAIRLFRWPEAAAHAG